MVIEYVYLIVNNVEGSSRALIGGTVPAFAWMGQGKPKTSSVTVRGFLAEV
jgi:hypothetical protein